MLVRNMSHLEKKWDPLRYAAHVVERIFGTKKIVEKCTITTRSSCSGTCLWINKEKKMSLNKKKEEERNKKQIKHKLQLLDLYDSIIKSDESFYELRF